MRLVLMLIIALLSAIMAASGAETVFQPVDGFELDRYLGKWFEIARFPHKFEKGLDNVTATYTIREDGKVDVLNQGYKDDELKTAKGKAKFAYEKDVGHLKVTFFWPFYGDYIIVELDKENYEYVLVVGDSYDYLWVLSRKSKLDENILEKLLAKAEELGFDLSKIIMVAQDK